MLVLNDYVKNFDINVVCQRCGSSDIDLFLTVERGVEIDCYKCENREKV